MIISTLRVGPLGPLFLFVWTDVGTASSALEQWTW